MSILVILGISVGVMVIGILIQRWLAERDEEKKGKGGYGKKIKWGK